ncbi:MAG: OPT family oligopeptide transporter [Myxococcota bacterium]
MAKLASPSTELTVRALGTGMILGGVLSLCNIYAGLKIGWGFNMSVTAALLGFGLWSTVSKKPFGIFENNINQTAASSAASISSAGLVAPIPALTMIDGTELSYPALAAWCLSVALVGVVVGVGLRRQLIVVDALPFPGGIVSAETLKSMYAEGTEALKKVRALLAAGVIAAIAKITVDVAKIGKLPLPFSVAAKNGSASGVASFSAKNLGFALDPSMMLPAVGALIGLRAGLSILLGSVIAWGIFAPMALDAGWADPGAPEGGWFGTVNKWMLWPGVAMMVTSSLTSFSFSGKSILRALRGKAAPPADDDTSTERERDEVPRNQYMQALLFALVLAVVLQVLLFGIPLWLAALGVLLTYALAIVAGRVSGETNITPVGPMGKVTQLLFGVISPGSAATNLMTANVTGGAASQCGDLLHDLKAGYLIGASPRRQAIAQGFGVLAGALFGAAGYLILVPDPKNMLLTEEWSAPAVAAWKSVAELFMIGIDALQTSARWGIVWGGLVGIVLAVLEKVLPEKGRAWVPSPSGVGLAFVIPAYYGIAISLGSIAAAIIQRFAKSWAATFLIVVASGLIAGESLAGVGLALQKIAAG